MKKNCIVTPTYPGHFRYITKYLKSFDKYVIDKDNVEIYFTISKIDKENFDHIISPFISRLPIKVLLFEDILLNYKIKESPEELLLKYGKFSFQTLKKFYTMLYVNAEHYLVLDSESMWVQKTNMNELFKNFFSHPFISGSNLEERVTSQFVSDVLNNINLVLDYKCDKWFLENFVWFYDIKILNDLFRLHGSPLEIINYVYNNTKYCNTVGVFEILLYQNFIYKHNTIYNYQVNDVIKSLKNVLSEKMYNDYNEKYNKEFRGDSGILEHAMVILDKQNLDPISNLFKQLNFNIIRCDFSYKNYILQKNFINIVSPYILAASQDHFFGLNSNLVLVSYTREVLKRSLKVLKESFKKILKKVSPAYKVSTELRDLVLCTAQENRQNFCYVNNNFVRLERLQNLDIIENNKINRSNIIFHYKAYKWFNNKNILIINDSYGDFATPLVSLGAKIYFLDSRLESCRLLQKKFPGFFVELLTEDILLNNIEKSKVDYDLIVHVGAVSHQNTSFLKWCLKNSKTLFFSTSLYNIETMKIDNNDAEDADGYKIVKDADEILSGCNVSPTQFPLNITINQTRTILNTCFNNCEYTVMENLCFWYCCKEN